MTTTPAPPVRATETSSRHDRDPDANGIFDEGNGVTTRVSQSIAGVAGNLESGGPKISGDGTVVAFVGPASNLVTGDTNNAEDVFARVLATSTTTRLSVNSTETEAKTPLAIMPGSGEGSISGSGQYVAFTSGAVNPVARDRNRVDDAFIHDRDSDGLFDEAGAIETRRLSVSTTGVEGNLASGRPSTRNRECPHHQAR